MTRATTTWLAPSSASEPIRGEGRPRIPPPVTAVPGRIPSGTGRFLLRPAGMEWAPRPEMTRWHAGNHGSRRARKGLRRPRGSKMHPLSAVHVMIAHVRQGAGTSILRALYDHGIPVEFRFPGAPVSNSPWCCARSIMSPAQAFPYTGARPRRERLRPRPWTAPTCRHWHAEHGNHWGHLHGGRCPMNPTALMKYGQPRL